MTVSFRDALPYRPGNLDATSYHGRSGISKGPMGQKSWENAFLRDTPDHSSHLPCRIGEFSTAKNVRLFIASAATYGGGRRGNMEPRFGLRCRGVVRCLCGPVRSLKSCLHHCDWTEDDLTWKLRCHRFIILQFPAEGAAGASAVFAISDVYMKKASGSNAASAAFAISNSPSGFCGAVVGPLRLNRSGRFGIKSKKNSSELQSFFML